MVVGLRGVAAAALAVASLPRCAADETNVMAYVEPTAAYLFVFFYVILMIIPIARFLVVRYTAKINAAISSYAESISQRISAAKAANALPAKVKLKPRVRRF